MDAATLNYPNIGYYLKDTFYFACLFMKMEACANVVTFFER